MKNVIEYLEEKLEKAKKSKATMTTTDFLQKELRLSVERDEDAYEDTLTARTTEEIHEALSGVHEARQKAEVRSEDEEQEPRKKGYLEKVLDKRLFAYFEAVSGDLDGDTVKTLQRSIVQVISQLEVNRRVRFLYDLQKLRIGANNRRMINEMNYGIKDIYMDYSGAVLEKLETQNVKMIDRVMAQSPDGEFYNWLKENHVGVGPQMAACIISELSAPERFRTVSCLWAYSGLHVVGHNDGGVGRAPRREAGKMANWNSFLKTKLVGVLADIFVKSQTRHAGTDKGRNIDCLNGYKQRLIQKNNLIPVEEHIFKDKKGKKEITQTNSKKKTKAFNHKGESVGEIIPEDVKRRSLGHMNNMAKRYMIKMFLCDILNQWRVLKGMEPLLTYDEAKLRGGVKHGENPHLEANASI